MSDNESLDEHFDLDLEFLSYESLRLIGTLLLGFIIVQLIGTFCYVFTRFLKIRCSAKIQPDASKAILITGATSGLGLCLAKRLHKLGFTIFACYYSELEPGYKELIKIGKLDFDRTRMFLVPLDVCSQESISKCHEIVESNLREFNLKLHALVNNAGCSFDGPFEWLDKDFMDRVIDTNLIGCINITRQFVKRIIIDKGRFINVSSIFALFPTKTSSIYGATKSALANFSEALHYDLEPYGSASYSIFPGNLMASTNIVFTALRGAQESVSKLSIEEQTLFSNSIQATIKICQYLVRVRIDQAHYDIDEIEQSYKVDLDFLRQSEIQSKTNKDPSSSMLEESWVNLKKLINKTLTGDIGNESLEQSRAIVYSYEAAVLLKNPPKRLYAGSTFFIFIAGPICELIPWAGIKSISSMLFNAFLARVEYR